MSAGKKAEDRVRFRKLNIRQFKKISGDFGMGITVEAIYESGVLKPVTPLDTLREHERVRITVQPVGVVAHQRRERIKLDHSCSRNR